jgi:1,4-dihydroxy-2-naphthoate octaprenyltransferase
LGDLFVFIFFGLVAVGGTYYVQTLSLTPLVLWTAVAPGLLITAILVVNNLRDLETDRRANKRTLAVFIGAQATRYQYLLLMIVAYLVPLGLWVGAGKSVWVLLPLLTLPLAIRLIRTLWRANTGPVFNATLAGTAQLSFLFSLLLAVGLWIS